MTTKERDVYVTTLSVEDIFADYTYQRELDAPRAKRMAAEWNRRLVGIVEVSDRGTFATPRYAVVDGQHRWAAARLLDPAPMLVVNVHEGARAQGFADDYEFVGTAAEVKRQIGNAVPVGIARFLGERAAEALGAVA